ncbi:MFS transporter [Paenibacillus sp. LMG 31456]|uniref:MFS transporter n=2 Tax=Paenibacillus foliorum TaxID=2654974 RepID=A0A972K0K0_9BACL|nr:MFS transporter [Paenibacillus foliorum]
MFLTVGAFDSVRGILTNHMGAAYSLDLAQLGTLLAAAPAGYLFSGPIVGWIIDKIGAKHSLQAAIILLFTSLIGLVTIPNYFFLVFLFFVSGFSKGALETSLNYVTSLWFIQYRARFLGFVHAGYGLGAFLFPMLTGFLFLQGLEWRGIYGIFLVIFLISFLMLFLFKTEKSERQVTEPTKVKEILKSKRLQLLVAATMFYVGAEVGFLSWLPYYLPHIKAVAEDIVPYYIGAFFILMMAGRFFGGFIADRIGYELAIMIGAGLGGILMLAAQLGSSDLGWMFSLIGLFFSLIFPTFVAMASRDFNKSSGTVIGYLTSAAGIGATTTSWLMGILGKWYGFQFAFIIPVVFTALLIIVVAWLYTINRQTRGLSDGSK